VLHVYFIHKTKKIYSSIYFHVYIKKDILGLAPLKKLRTLQERCSDRPDQSLPYLDRDIMTATVKSPPKTSISFLYINSESKRCAWSLTGGIRYLNNLSFSLKCANCKKEPKSCSCSSPCADNFFAYWEAESIFDDGSGSARLFIEGSQVFEILTSENVSRKLLKSCETVLSMSYQSLKTKLIFHSLGDMGETVLDSAVEAALDPGSETRNLLNLCSNLRNSNLSTTAYIEKSNRIMEILLSTVSKRSCCYDLICRIENRLISSDDRYGINSFKFLPCPLSKILALV